MHRTRGAQGWGCAYRSIQTICSWYRLQGYSAKAVPTHRQIQEVLVAKGGRPPSLIGSSQWVGAVEASMFLNVWFEVRGQNAPVRLFILFSRCGARVLGRICHGERD